MPESLPHPDFTVDELRLAALASSFLLFEMTGDHEGMMMVEKQLKQGDITTLKSFVAKVRPLCIH